MLSEQPSGATRVLAVIPAHDEAPRIAAVVRGAVTHLPVLVVDDGSTDGTARIAREAGAEVLEQRPNARLVRVISSVLVGRVHVCDIFVSIDGEDVTQRGSREITNIMARKSEFERVLRLCPAHGERQ